MKKYIKNLFFISSVLFALSAANASSSSGMDISGTIFAEAFITIHMSFVLFKLSKIISKDDSKKIFLLLFLVRIVFLAIGDLIDPGITFVIDFFSIFILGMGVIPIIEYFKSKKMKDLTQIVNNITPKDAPATSKVDATLNAINYNEYSVKRCIKCGYKLSRYEETCPYCGTIVINYNTTNNFGNVSSDVSSNVDTLNNNDEKVGLERICEHCGYKMKVYDKKCPYCGAVVAELASNNKYLEDNPIVSTRDFEMLYTMDEEKMLDSFIKDEMERNNIVFDNIKDMIPEEALRRKKILNIIWGVLVFIYIALIFFHYPLLTYVVSTIVLIVCCRLFKKFDLLAYLKKEMKARPSEKVSNIIMATKNSLVSDNSKGGKITCAIFAIIVSIFVFYKPNIIYEKADNGYAVRFYLCGITNFTTATIPSTYKNQNVVSLRGNTFSNMPFLTSVELPDTITEIRGQAFKNDTKLESVNIPSKLEYIGGGAFYGCTSIKSVEFPDTVTEMGGEIFYGASSLQNVRLSENITEIRGDSFEYCTSLTSIKIPDKVTRIGGHAFYGDTRLSNVIISGGSDLKEIGSSAFRECYALKNISLPSFTSVNEKAFKESPTQVSRF